MRKALESVGRQTYADFEVVIVNDGSSDETDAVIKSWEQEITQVNKLMTLQVLQHNASIGITRSRQEALEKSNGELVAILDDDDEWVYPEKLQKQVVYLQSHSEAVLVGGSRVSEMNGKSMVVHRPVSDSTIRRTILFKNPFFTSSVMFRKHAAVAVGGFMYDGEDFAEDYDLWIRLGEKGDFYNFPDVFVKYRLPSYNKERVLEFLHKQKTLVARYGRGYPFFHCASLLWPLRLFLFPLLGV